jgi:hypothetical protein
MKTKLFFWTLLFFTTSQIFSQERQIIVNPNIQLPNDSIVSKKLINSINGFLSEKEKPNKENSFVLNEDLVEMSLLLDELKGIEKSGKFKDDNFYKAYLSNVISTNENNYLLQFSFIGVNENVPYLMATIELIAKQKDDKFYFMSTLKKNTSLWKTKQIENYAFHYKEKINSKTVKKYVEKVKEFDKKFNSTGSKIEWYGCDNMQELLNLIGISYKLTYNGRTSSNFSAIENNTLLIVDGNNNTTFETFDPHDLFHERATNIIEQSKINRSMICGTAYIYGGSWGISWEDITKAFKEKVASNTASDWLKLYSEGYNFGESQEKHLLVTQYINALIAKKVEKEQGFPVVIELLSSGNFKKNPDNFFQILEKITGINKTNFNEKVWELVRAEK